MVWSPTCYSMACGSCLCYTTAWSLTCYTATWSPTCNTTAWSLICYTTAWFLTGFTISQSLILALVDRLYPNQRVRLHEPGLAANLGQVASPDPPFSSQTLVQLQAFDWKRVYPGWRPDPGWQPTRDHVNGPKEYPVWLLDKPKNCFCFKELLKPGFHERRCDNTITAAKTSTRANVLRGGSFYF